MGQYRLLFRGVSETVPSYDLYIGPVLAAHFPSAGGGPLIGTEYAYANVSIVTTDVAPDGTAAAGIITFK